MIFFFYIHTKIWVWKAFPPWEMNGVTTWGIGSNTPLKFKPYTKNNPNPTNQTSKNKIWFLSDGKQILFVKIAKYFYMRGTSKKTSACAETFSLPFSF